MLLYKIMSESAKKLVKGRKYKIDYTAGPDSYFNFNGVGEYTGKINDEDEEYYGFILDDMVRLKKPQIGFQLRAFTNLKI